MRWKLVPAIPDILTKGEYLGRTLNRDTQRKPGHIAYHVFEAPVRLEGKDYTAKVTVWKDRAGKKYYDLDTEAPSVTPGETGAAEPPEGSKTTLDQSIRSQSPDINIDLTELNLGG